MLWYKTTYNLSSPEMSEDAIAGFSFFGTGQASLGVIAKKE
jgi:hypothetical protein